MLFGRLVGLLMMLAGGGLLLQYHSDLTGFWNLAPDSASAWNFGRESMSDYLSWSLGLSFSAALTSGWTAAALIVLGALLVWGCRRGPSHNPR